MKYVPLGRSGLVVSTRALGTMTFGAETDRATAFAQLDAYVEAGGTLIELADVYGGGRAEEIVGEWLAGKTSSYADRLVLATKGRFPVGVDARDAGTSRRHLRRALEASLRRLGVDHVDLYQVHSWDPVTPPDETIGFLEDAVQRGSFGYAGLSNYLGWQIAQAAAMAAGRVPLISMQPQYNLLAREVEWEIIPSSLAHGLGVLPWSPLAGGWLTGKYTLEQAPTGATRLGEDPERGVEAYGPRSSEERTWRVLDAVAAVAERHARPASEVALAWLGSRPGVSSIILGARSVEQLEANLVDTLELTAADQALLDEASDPRPSAWPYGESGVEQRARPVA